MFSEKGNRLPDQTERAYAPAIAAALRAELGQGHRAAKTVMRWTGASERSAKNWLSGATAPTGWHLILLARRSEGVARTFLSLAGRSEYGIAADLHLARTALALALRQVDSALNPM
ncbi:MAG: hypothetical protein JWR77_1076 [Rhizorhabdus sp.]|nr:hypothetical protein [Rhizorhabdus sp.]